MAFEPPKLVLAGSGAADLPSIGNVVRDPLSHWPERLLESGVILTAAGRRPLAFVSNPQAISTILMNRDGNFPRARFQDRVLGASYGENLIQAQQEDWRHQRRSIAQPITSERALSLVPRLERAASAMLDEWAQSGPDTPIDLLRDSRRMSLDALYRSLFADADQAAHRDPQVDETARAIAAKCPIDLREELALLRPLAERLATDWNGGSSDDQSDAAKELNTLTLFLHAGHDNASTALAWMLWLAAHRPDLQDAVRREAAARAQGKFVASDLPVTIAVVHETLRLFPPIMQLLREVETPLAVGEVTVEPGSLAIVAIYAMHRHRTLWDRPDAFLPERFLREGATTRMRRPAWLPFGTGPRGCIGASLATIELGLFFAMICERFTIEPNPDCPLQCHVEWTVRPVGDAPIFVRPRS